MILRALIVDDEAPARTRLRDLLDEVPDVAVVGEAANGTEALERIAALQPTFVLLDVRMPGPDGTEVARRIEGPQIVFTTAHAEHAVAAFELQAIDYLLKPVTRDRLGVAVDRVRRRCSGSDGGPSDGRPSQSERVEAALTGGPLRRIFVRRHGTLIPVAVETIVRFEADGDYVEAHVAGGRSHVLQVTMKAIEGRLDPAQFVRVHRSHIVNLDRVTAFRPHDGARLEAEMTDGSRVVASRARSKWLRGIQI